MTLAWVGSSMVGDLARSAEESPRRRQHRNLHHDYSDPAQRLLNYVCMDSYIRPHRHLVSGCDETLIALRGLFGIVTFEGDGTIGESGRFGSEYHAEDGQYALAIVVGPEVWHTVVALTPGAVLFECKAGPFDPNAAKEQASWAPEEGSHAAIGYLQQLRDVLLTGKRA